MGRALRRRAARRLQAPGRQRRLGASVPDVPADVRVRQRRGVQEALPRRRGLSRPQADPLVQALPHRARRGRDRVRRRDVAVHLRALQAVPGARGVRAGGRRAGRCLRPDLDDDAVDAAGQRRRVLRPRHRLLLRQGRRRLLAVRPRDGRGRRRGVRLGVLRGRVEGRRAGAHEGRRVRRRHLRVPDPHRPRRPHRVGRPRHARLRHRRGPHRSRPRRRGLPDGPAVRPRHAHARRRRRPLHGNRAAFRRHGHRRGQPPHHRLAA